MRIERCPVCGNTSMILEGTETGHMHYRSPADVKAQIPEKSKVFTSNDYTDTELDKIEKYAESLKAKRRP